MLPISKHVLSDRQFGEAGTVSPGPSFVPNVPGQLGSLPNITQLDAMEFESFAASADGSDSPSESEDESGYRRGPWFEDNVSFDTVDLGGPPGTHRVSMERGVSWARQPFSSLARPDLVFEDNSCDDVPKSAHSTLAEATCFSAAALVGSSPTFVPPGRLPSAVTSSSSVHGFKSKVRDDKTAGGSGIKYSGLGSGVSKDSGEPYDEALMATVSALTSQVMVLRRDKAKTDMELASTQEEVPPTSL